ncbi:MAG: WD40 repeat domain-containing protein [Pirellulales bacterium]
MAEYREVRLMDVAKRELIRRFQVADGRQLNRPGQVALSPDGTRLVAAGDFHAPMNVWDTTSGQVVFSISWSGNERPGPVVFSPDGRTAIVAVGPTIRIYDVKSGRETLFEGTWRRRLQSADFSPDGKSLAICGYGDRGVQLFDVASCKLRHELAADEKTRAVAFSRDCSTLATGGQTVALWSAGDGSKIRTIQPNLAPPRVTGPTITSLVYSTDDRKLLAGSQLGDLQMFRLDDARLLRSLPQPIDADGHQDRVRGLVRFPDGKRVATRTGNVLLWDLQNGDLLASWEASGCDGEPGRPLALSPDGRTLAYERRVESDGRSKLESVLHDTSTLKPPRPLKFGDNSLERFSEVSFAFSPDGRLLATGAADNSVRIWNVETGEELRRFDGHIDRVSYVDFSPDGKLLASTSWDGTVLLWSVQTLTGSTP